MLLVEEEAEVLDILVGQTKVAGLWNSGMFAVVACSIVEEEVVAIEVVGDVEFLRVGEQDIGKDTACGVAM